MSEHPFTTLRVTASEVVEGALSPDRLAAVVESIRRRGAAIVDGAVAIDHCDALCSAMAEDLEAAARHPAALEVPGHVQHNQRVTFLVDDASPQGAHAVEIRAIAELHETGGDKINPRFEQFKPQFIRLRPHYVVSWGLSSDGSKEGFTTYGRRVG